VGEERKTRTGHEEREKPRPAEGRELVREAGEPYAGDQEGLREFVHRWAKAGPALEEQRARQLGELDDETARRMTLDLFELWRPSESDEMGGGLVEAARVFKRLARSEAGKRPQRLGDRQRCNAGGER